MSDVWVVRLGKVRGKGEYIAARGLGVLCASLGRKNWARLVEREEHEEWDWSLYDYDRGLFVAMGIADTEELAKRSVEAMARVLGWIDDDGRLKL